MVIQSSPRNSICYDCVSLILPDINECEESKPCDENGRCENLPGKFKCSCLEGYEGDGMRSNGTGCRPNLNSNSGKYTILVVTLSKYMGIPNPTYT